MKRFVSERSYHSKVLLFGEYSVIKNSMALACNYPLFDGKLIFARGGAENETENSINSRKELRIFGNYIEKYLIEHDDSNFRFDATTFKFDLEHGLYFSSSIPQGYGVGSSAAVSAAIFENYCEIIDEGSNYILTLRNIFKILESFFHGQSSGIDPLICFLNSSILVKSLNEIGIVSLPQFNPEGAGAMFLVSTGRPHKTGPLVSIFLEKCHNLDFMKKCHETLIPVTNNIISLFLKGDMDKIWDDFFTLSQFQYEQFVPMIPEDFRPFWREGLEKREFLLKLCGAGGGGFLLGITKNFEAIKDLFPGYQMRPLFSF